MPSRKAKTNEDFAGDLEPDHRELAALEVEFRIARRRQREKPIGPVMDGKDFLFADTRHD